MTVCKCWCCLYVPVDVSSGRVQGGPDGAVGGAASLPLKM